MAEKPIVTCNRKIGVSCGREIKPGEMARNFPIHLNFGAKGCKTINEWQCAECVEKAKAIFEATAHQEGWLKRSGVAGDWQKRQQLAALLGVSDLELIEFDRRLKLAPPDVRAKFEAMFPEVQRG